MIVAFDKFSRFEPLTIYLCNPGSTFQTATQTPNRILGIYKDTSDEEIVFNFNQTSELSFRVTDDMHNDISKNMLDKTKNRRLVFVKDVGYFKITEATLNIDENNMRYVDVKAESVESEIMDKAMPYIKDDTYRFQTSTDKKEKGLLDTIVAHLPKWLIGHVDASVAKKYRSFEDVSEEQNILSFMLEDMQDAYECIFIFDIINRQINVYDQNNYVRRTSIHLTIDDLINSMEINEDSSELYTALRTTASEEDVYISPVNPLGSNTIYKFDYFLEWMPTSLAKKVTQWELAVANAEQNYYNKNLSLYEKKEKSYDLEAEIKKYNTQISTYKKCKENIVADFNKGTIESYNKVLSDAGGIPVNVTGEASALISQINNQVKTVNADKTKANTTLTTTKNEIKSLEKEIDAISEKLALKNYFTTTELDELNTFIFEGTYTDDHVKISTDTMSYSKQFEQMKTLYDRAKSMLDHTSEPTTEYTLDIQNFLFVSDFKHFSNQLETGCLINVEVAENDVAALFLTSMTVNYSDQNLSMTFGNRFNKFDPKSLFSDVLGKITRSSNTLSYLKSILYPIKSGEFNVMKETLANSRNITMAEALASENQSVSIDGAGYTGRTLLEDGTYDPRQVKLINKNLVFTDDAWETCKVAIGEILTPDGKTVYGINAEAIYGDIFIGGGLRLVDKAGRDMFVVENGVLTINMVDDDGNRTQVIIDANGIKTRLDKIEQGEFSSYNCIMSSTKGLLFKSSPINTTLKAEFYRGQGQLTATQIMQIGQIRWYDETETTLLGVGATYNLTNRTEKSLTFVTHLYDEKNKKILCKGMISVAVALDGQNGKDATPPVKLEIVSTEGTAFKNSQAATVLKVYVYNGTKEINTAAELKASLGSKVKLQWKEKKSSQSGYTDVESTDSRLLDSGFSFIISAADVGHRAVFNCELVSE